MQNATRYSPLPPPQPKRVLGYRKSDGRWQIKIDGQLRIFGSRTDARNPTLSMEDRYARAMKDYDTFAAARIGFAVKTYDVSGLTLTELGNLYLDWMDKRIQINEIKARNYLDIKTALIDFTRIIGGGSRLVATLTPADFAKARIAWQRLDPYSLNRRVAWVRSWFIWADDEDHIEHRPKFGKMFKRAGIKVMRDSMTENAIKFGDKAFTPEEIRRIFPALGWEMRAPFLLGLNCAFYAEDISCLTLEHIDLDLGFHWMKRGKNHNFRVCALWDITVEAIRDYISHRWGEIAERRGKKLTPKTPIFCTRSYNAFVHWTITRSESGEILRSSQSNNGTKELNKVLDRLDIGRDGVSFGALRHTFITTADAMGKEVECALIAGHKRPGVIEFYVRKYSKDALHKLANQRTRPVVNYVRKKIGI